VGIAQALLSGLKKPTRYTSQSNTARILQELFLNQIKLTSKSGYIFLDETSCHKQSDMYFRQCDSKSYSKAVTGLAHFTSGNLPKIPSMFSVVLITFGKF